MFHFQFFAKGKFRWLGLIATILLLGAWPVRLLDAQEIDDLKNDPETNQEIRSRLFDSLAKDIAALEQQSNVLKKVVKLVRPTVVHINAEKNDQSNARYGRPGAIEEAGSGFIVRLDNKHYVLTNRHVVKFAAVRDITIKLADGRQITPTKTWSDPATDVAVLAVGDANLLASRLGNSDQVEIGDFVLAIGSPFGLSHSVTFGIISATGRRNLEVGDEVRFKDFLQTDAAVNPGNSGGPLLNLRGEVLGMNTAIASNTGRNEGIGFAIPINMVMMVAQQLVERGTVVRAFLGVTLDSKFDPAMAISVGLQRPRGARVSRVTPGSPAEAAKLQVGDVILEFGGTRVDDDNHLINLVSMTDVGKEVPLVVLRDHKLMNVLVKVAASTPAATER